MFADECLNGGLRLIGRHFFREMSNFLKRIFQCGWSYEAIFNWLIQLAEQAVIVGELCVQSHKTFEDL